MYWIRYTMKKQGLNWIVWYGKKSGRREHLIVKPWQLFSLFHHFSNALKNVMQVKVDFLWFSPSKTVYVYCLHVNKLIGSLTKWLWLLINTLQYLFFPLLLYAGPVFGKKKLLGHITSKRTFLAVACYTQYISLDYRSASNLPGKCTVKNVLRVSDEQQVKYAHQVLIGLQAQRSGTLKVFLQQTQYTITEQ